MITSENADGPTIAIPTYSCPPSEEPEGWAANLTESPWRLIGFHESGLWDSSGRQRLISSNERLQEQLSQLKKVR